MPLRRGGPVLQAAAARGGVTPQLPRNGRRRPPQPAGDLPHPRGAVRATPARAGSQAPPVPQTITAALTAASTMAQALMVACRPPLETILSLPQATPPHQPPRPRLIDPLRSPSRTAAGPRAAPPPAAPATPTYPAKPDPNVADPPSQPPPSRCCDHHLNLPSGFRDVQDRSHWSRVHCAEEAVPPALPPRMSDKSSCRSYVGRLEIRTAQQPRAHGRQD